MIQVLRLSKRQKFFIATVLVVLSLVAIRLGFWPPKIQWRFRAGGYAIFATLVSLWALHDEDFSGIEWFMLLILPIIFVVGAALTYPLLPVEVPQFLFWTLDTDTGLFLAAILRASFLGFLALAYYASLLTENIFNVAALRTIQLFRAAHSTAFFLSLVSILFLHLVVYSFHLPAYLNFLAILILVFPLSLQSVWSINLEPKLSREVIGFSLTVSFVLAQLALVLSFWPVTAFVFTLFQTVAFYELIGVVHYRLTDRLHRTLVNELVLVGVTLLVLTIFSTSWSG